MVKKNFAPGSFGCHELMDRTSVAIDYLASTLLDHEACTGKWRKLANKAVDALGKMYQSIANEHMTQPKRKKK